MQPNSPSNPYQPNADDTQGAAWDEPAPEQASSEPSIFDPAPQPGQPAPQTAPPSAANQNATGTPYQATPAHPGGHQNQPERFTPDNDGRQAAAEPAAAASPATGGESEPHTQAAAPVTPSSQRGARIEPSAEFQRQYRGLTEDPTPPPAPQTAQTSPQPAAPSFEPASQQPAQGEPANQQPAQGEPASQQPAQDEPAASVGEVQPTAPPAPEQSGWPEPAGAAAEPVSQQSSWLVPPAAEPEPAPEPVAPTTYRSHLQTSNEAPVQQPEAAPARPAPEPTPQPQQQSERATFGAFELPPQEPATPKTPPAHSPATAPTPTASFAAPVQPAASSPWQQQTQPLQGFTPSQPSASIKSSLAVRFRNQLRSSFARRSENGWRSHLKPMLGIAAISALIYLLFNSQVILGQIQYLTTSGVGEPVPAIVDPTTTTTEVTAEPRIIIPKINVNVPVVYEYERPADDPFNEEAVQKALEDGVVHYGTTARPGQNGNSVIVGHSSNNWWASGAYKFAFILLDRLEEGDTFVLHYESQRYVYEVFNSKVVEPTEVSVLRQTEEPIVTLITCTPPGTSWRRLVVQARQISPDPAQNEVAPVEEVVPTQQLPSDGGSAFNQVRGWLFGN